MASSAVPATATISNPPSLSIIRPSTARATIESSTIINRWRRPPGGIDPASWPDRDKAGTPLIAAASGHADELQLDVQRFAIERLHDIFVGAGLERGADVRHVVFGGAEDDLGLVFMAALA